MKATHLMLAAAALFATQGCEKKADEAPPAAKTEKAQKAAPAPEKAPEEAPEEAPADDHAGHGHGDDHAGHDHAGHDHAGHDHGGPSGATAGAAKAAGQGVLFAFPDDGSKVFEDFSVAFLVMGKTITPAGEAIDDASKGHHHIIVDGEPTPAGTVVKADETHIHYGKGETHAMLKLAPGKHTLTLQLADGAHRSYGPEWAKTINVEVVPNPAKAAGVMFVEPAGGAKLKSPVKVKFAVDGFTIRPAGEDTKDHTSGHHHLIIDGKPTPAGIAVPADATHIHYGKGQIEAEVELTPGTHTLTMQFADGAHRAYGDYMTASIDVTVE